MSLSLLVLMLTAQYPPPAVVSDAPQLKFASGIVASMEKDAMVLQTEAGPLEVKLDGAVVLNAPEAREGQSAEVWYETGDGARAREVDFVDPAVQWAAFPAAAASGPKY